MQKFKETLADTKNASVIHDLDAINSLSKVPLSADEVFTFDILLCDNEIDRDFERFTIPALVKLEELFMGTTGIFDHTWSALGQKARIYKTNVVRDDSRVTIAGEPYTYLKASAYMLKNDENMPLIDEIKAGIKKEVSVGCSVAKTSCNICGEPDGSPACSHVRGALYNDILCCRVLDEPTDAYEWSFVAVPAQRDAGVIKHFAGHCRNDADNIVDREAFKRLESEAQLGRTYLKNLRDETAMLGIMLVPEIPEDTLKSVLLKLNEAEILCFKDVFQKRVDKLYPPACQLKYLREPVKIQNDQNENYYKI